MNYRRRGIQTRSNILKHPPARSTAQKITPKRLSAQLTTPTRSVNQTITPTKLTAQSSTPKTLTDQTTIPMGSTTQGNSLTKLGVQRTVRTRSTGQRTIPQRLSTQCDKLTMFTIENSLLTLSPTDKETKMVEQDETEANEVEYFQTTFGKRRTSLPAQVTIHPATRLAAVAEQKAQTISLRRSPFRMTANRMKLRQCHLKTPTPISQLREQTLLKQRPLNVDATSRRIDVDMLLQPCAQTANRSESQMDSTTINSRLIYPSLVMTPGHSYSPFVGSDTTVTQRPATKSSLYEVARESESGRALELNAITPEVKQRSACVHTPGNQPSLANISGSPASRSTRVKLKTHTPRYNQKCARAFNSPTRRDSKILRLGKKLAPRSQAMRLKTKFSPSPAPAVVPKNSKPGEPTRHFGTLISQNVETPEEAIGRLPSVASPRDILLTKQSLQIVNSVVLRSSKKLTPQTSKVQTPKADFLSSPAKSFTCSPKRSQRCHTPERLKTNSSVNVTPRSQKVCITHILYK